MLGCPETDLNIRIPVLVFYLGGHSKKHWLGNGKAVGKAVKGSPKPATPEVHSLGNHPELSQPRGKELRHSSSALSVTGQSCFWNVNLTALLAGLELRPSVSHDQKKPSLVPVKSMERNTKGMRVGLAIISSKTKPIHQYWNQKAK